MQSFITSQNECEPFVRVDERVAMGSPMRQRTFGISAVRQPTPQLGRVRTRPTSRHVSASIRTFADWIFKETYE